MTKRPRERSQALTYTAIMRYLMGLCLCFLSFSFALEEIVSARVRVLFDDPALAPYAREVASKAEQALDALEPLFGAPDRAIILRFERDTDLFNAFANALPRPNVSLRPIFPNDGTLGYQGDATLYQTLVHELTHITQFAFTEGPDGPRSGLRLGLVGEGIASVPPPWLVEGLATWAESVYAPGGRLEDPLTTGLLDTLALSESWPSLTDISLSTYAPWPGGSTRYLLGAGFIAYLVEEHGLEALQNTLRQYNVGGLIPQPFSAAWQRAVGTDLASEWEAYRAALETRAEARTAELDEQILLTNSGWYTGEAVFSPDGARLAWVSWPPALSVADLSGDELDNRQTFLEGSFAYGLDWLDENRLVYSRVIPEGRSSLRDLFVLDLRTGRETRLTYGARAQFPAVTPAGCVLYVRDVVPEGSSLYELCEDIARLRWRAPANAHILGLTVSEGGQLLMSLRADGFVDLALLEGETLRYLTRDAFQDLDPVWQDEETIIFRSNRSEVYELYRLELATQTLSQLSETPGGALQPAVTDDRIIYTALGENGLNLALLEPLRLEPASLSFTSTAAPSLPQRELRTQTYRPFASLLPYGWRPSVSISTSPLGGGLGGIVYGKDDSGLHSYAFDVGYDTTLTGPLAGTYASLTYGYRKTVDIVPGPTYPVGLELAIGLWPHNPHLDPQEETALGAKAGLSITESLDDWLGAIQLEGAALYLTSYGAWQPDLRAQAVLTRQRSDSWGYRSSGPRYGVTGVWAAGKEGASAGVWADASYYSRLSSLGLPGTGELAFRAGYRQGPPVPLALDELSGVGTLGYRYSFSPEWRYQDGLFAVERITLEPRLRTWFDGNFGLGSDLTLSLDTVLNYAAPTTIGFTVGYSQVFWTGFVFRVTL